MENTLVIHQVPDKMGSADFYENCLEGSVGKTLVPQARRPEVGFPKTAKTNQKNWVWRCMRLVPSLKEMLFSPITEDAETGLFLGPES